MPELSSYIQTIVDSRDKPGKFILTGSQQFELIAGVSQSLAGRTDIARLLPLSYQELYSKSSAPDLATMLYTGFYPRIHDKKLDPSEAMSFYFSTYVERDLRQIPHVRDLGSFERFMHLLAGRNGQILCFFEAYVIAEFFKSLYNRGKPDTLLYFRDQKGHEVDLISETQPETLLCEIKSSATFHPDFLAGMNYVEALLAQPVKKRLIMGSLDEPYWFKDTHVLGYSRAGDVE